LVRHAVNDGNEARTGSRIKKRARKERENREKRERERRRERKERKTPATGGAIWRRSTQQRTVLG